jgi:hypothetical protein
MGMAIDQAWMNHLASGVKSLQKNQLTGQLSTAMS